MMTHTNLSLFRRTAPTPFTPPTSYATKMSSFLRVLLFLFLFFHLASPTLAISMPAGRTLTAGTPPTTPHKRPLCVSHLDPLNPHIMVPHDNCSSPGPPPYRLTGQGPPGPPPSFSDGIPLIRTDLTCIETDDLTCAKVRRAFDSVAARIGRAIWLSAPVKVNATFYPLCKSAACSVLGAAAPSRSFLLMDDDSVARAYPQALVKQLNFTTITLNYDTYDITAQFNSKIKFWFANDAPIQPGQIDFEFLVLHELMHGLGFISLWRDYFERNILTPCPLTPASSNKDMTANERYIFQGFIESAFDRHIVDKTLGTRLSVYTARLDQFSHGPGTVFLTLRSFLDEFLSSSQFRIASRLYRLATTPGAMAFIANTSISSSPEDLERVTTPTRFLLETSIRKYRIGSTITHFDYRAFQDTPDFLMRWIVDDGITLDHEVAKANHPTMPTVGTEDDGIGPAVLRVLESLGYRTALSGGVTVYAPKLPTEDHMEVTNAAGRKGKENRWWIVGVVVGTAWVISGLGMGRIW